MGFYSLRIFPRVLDFFVSFRFLENHRRRVLAGVAGEVVEIGFGTGRNLPLYPAAVRALTIVDPNPGMHAWARGRASSGAFPVRALLAGAEAIPAGDGVFDCAVSTWSLCTIPRPERALAEVRRVLKPGGRFFFLEHGLSADPGVRRWQRRLNPLNRILADGCNIDRDIAALVAGSGLRVVELERFAMERTPRFFGSSYRGVAVNGALL